MHSQTSDGRKNQDQRQHISIVRWPAVRSHTIIISLKCMKNATNPFAQIILIDDDDSRITFELSLFVTNIKKEACVVLESFLSF